MSPSLPNYHWRQANALAERIPYYFTRSAKHHAITALLHSLRLALASGRR